MQYKSVAIDVTGHVIEVLDVNVFQDFYSILDNAINENLFEEKGSTLSNKERDEILDLKAKGFEALGKSWPKDISIQLQYLLTVFNLMSKGLQHSILKIQAGTLKSLIIIFERYIINK